MSSPRGEGKWVRMATCPAWRLLARLHGEQEGNWNSQRRGHSFSPSPQEDFPVLLPLSSAQGHVQSVVFGQTVSPVFVVTSHKGVPEVSESFWRCPSSIMEGRSPGSRNVHEVTKSVKGQSKMVALWREAVLWKSVAQSG